MFPKDRKLEGIEPVSELTERSRNFKFLNSPNVAGIKPARLLSWRYKEVSRLKLPSVPGIEPEILHERRSRTSRLANRFPNQSGIDPGSGNPEALKETNRVKLTKESTLNLGLSRPSLVLFKPETLILETEPFRHSIPSHDEQGSDLMGQSLPRRPKDARRSSNARRSIGELNRAFWATTHWIKNKITANKIIDNAFLWASIDNAKLMLMNFNGR